MPWTKRPKRHGAGSRSARIPAAGRVRFDAADATTATHRASQCRVHTMSLALLTDLYQLTMASGYWQTGMAEREAVFHLFFRSPPFGGGYAVACGLEPATDYLRQLRFT